MALDVVLQTVSNVCMSAEQSDLSRSARMACILNALASAWMAVFMRHGLDPSRGIAERVRFISDHLFWWRISWIIWIFAALSLIGFFICWGRALLKLAPDRCHSWILLGVVVGIIGMVPDTIAETIYLGVLPEFKMRLWDMNGQGAAALEWQSVWIDVAQRLTGFLGNGFYCLGGLILSVMTLRTTLLPRGSAAASLMIWIVGLGLSGVALTDNMMLLTIMTALTMATFVVWTFWLGFWWQGKHASV